MGKSLKDLFEVSEVFDNPQEEMIAKILLNTSDENDNPADEPFKQLAAKVEQGKISIEDALEALDAITQQSMKETTTYVKSRNTQAAYDQVKTIKGDKDKSQKEKEAAIDALKDAKPGDKVVAEELDEEGRMAKSELLKLTQYSAKLYKALGDNDQLPAWIQSKITLAADYIGTVKHYLEGEQVMGGEDAPQGQLEEATKEVMNLEEVFNYIRNMIEEAEGSKDLPISITYPIPNSDRRGTVQLSLLRKALEAGSPESIKIQRDDVLEGPRINAKGDRRVGDLERMEITLRDALLALEPEGFGENPEERYEELDAEVEVKNDGLTMSLYIPALEPGRDAAASAKAKGNTRDVYENSLIKALSK